MENYGINNFCLSSYLAFRYVTKKNAEWKDGIKPDYPSINEGDQKPVSTSDDILHLLEEIISKFKGIKKVALFLSSGIDSAILAALLPKGTNTYTINFVSQSGISEAARAKQYSDRYGLEHQIIDVSWNDYLEYENLLMINKKAPLHPVEVALYKASLKAKADGMEFIMLGNGADSTFGGLDGLLKKDWTFDKFIRRYTFLEPQAVLENPVNIKMIYEPYRRNNHIDFITFLKQVHGIGIIQAFSNAISFAGLNTIEPFEQMKLVGKLDLERIRSGEAKYMLVKVFNQLYKGIKAPGKIAFARPMDEWLSDYTKPLSRIFIENIDYKKFTGNQKYLIHCLDKFITILDNGEL